ncbi:MAG TPA: hypothetical protein VK533_02050 [Sphingomonas sp.]|uniref:hypothetical protein n=1 Tax=Sphingomonas sp. TaxID=28214 RepID=UPI002BAD416F|nr:hypothetical protein [Sphingomonas sp.]HMI18307.1 hypothetical protein [Sphingomonas sp.]
MKIVPSLVLLLAAGAAQAQTAPKSAAPAVAQPQAPKRFPGVSDAGNAILAKAQTTPDPQLQALGRQAKAAHDQLMAATMAPVIDMDKVAAALHAQDDALTAVRTHNTDRLIMAAKQLPDDDKGVFLRTLMLAQQQRAAAPPAKPQP